EPQYLHSFPTRRSSDLYLDYKHIRISTFEKSTGLSNGSFGGQLKKNRSIGTDKLENIVRKYTDLNANWVLTGEGEMLKAPLSDRSEEHTSELQSRENLV